MKVLAGVLVAGMLTIGIGVQAEEKITSAEALVKSMVRADMTYRQLMESMGSSLSQISLGILSENKQLVERGTNYLLTHPAPRHNPWSIMPEEDQAGFKQALVTYDIVLEDYSIQIAEAAKQDQWLQANQHLNDLNTACISCHMAWRDKALTRAVME